MPTEPNYFVDLISAIAPVAGTFLTTIGGITIAKIGSNNNKELTSINNRLDVLQNTAVAQDSLIKIGEAIED